MENIDDIIEAILFALGRQISIEEISNTLKLDKSEVLDSIKSLEKKYDKDSAIVLLKVNNSYQLVTNHKYYEYVSKFVENTKAKNLSSAAYEVLSIIAYNPKITKTQIESIRGVNSDSAISRLLEAGLIEEVARLNLPGRPAAYSVTDEFLKSCGLDDISKLPEYEQYKVEDEQLMVQDVDKNIQNSDMEFKD